MQKTTEPARQAGQTVYEWTGPTGVKFRDVREPSGTYYHDTTPRPVIDALENARNTGARVRLFLGDRETGKDWNEENDVTGFIGRSSGPIKIPLLLRTKSSSGGGSILCDCIVRLLVNGREVYRHPKYKAPIFAARHSKEPGYAAEVFINDSEEVHARFKTFDAAFRWIAFMRGERATK